MSKYTKTEITEVDAFKWTGGPDQIEDPKWIVDLIKSGKVTFENQGTADIKMIILNKKSDKNETFYKQIAAPGDYIVKYSDSNLILVWQSNVFESNFKIDEIN